MHLILIVEGILTTIIQYIKTNTYQRNINKKLKSIKGPFRLSLLLLKLKTENTVAK